MAISAATRALSRFAAILGCALLAAACADPPDRDGDGADASDDCNDANAKVHPGAAEICDDELDNDCDLMVDSSDTDCSSGAGS